MDKKLYSHPAQLYYSLEEKFGADIKLNINEVNFGRITGEYKQIPFSIAFNPGQFLTICITQEGKELLEELKPCLMDSLGDVQPICSYDLNSIEEQPTSIVEWNIDNPEKRIREVVNKTYLEETTQMSNLKLYGGRLIEAYAPGRIVRR